MILRILFCAILQFCIIGYVFGVVPQITRLNVQCDRTGMKVNVEFDNPFNGIIFSKGHYSDPNCRWVSASSSRRQFNFYVGTSKCGTIGTDMAAGSSSPQGFKNVIIIQNDPDYQEVWDSARKLSCDWVTRLEKYVTFAPFGVDMLGVKELRFPGDTVDCWMDIQRGHGPFAPSVGGVVPIGEKLTVVIYVRDTDSSFDVHVKDCYAYDSSDYRNPNARAIKLTDERGCPVKEKLVQGFYRTRDVRNSGATIISYGIINAFKFPERMDVFLACNVEVCKGTCPNNDCQPEVAVAGTGETPAIEGSTTSAPATDGEDEEKPEGEGSSSTTEATETDDDDKTTEESTDSGSGTATEETESSEDTSEKPKDEESKDEETTDEESKDEETKDGESKDEESKDEESKDEESKDEEKTDEESKDEGDKEEDKKEEGESKDEEKEESNDVEEEKSTDTEEKKDEEKSEDDSETEKDTKEETNEDEKKSDDEEQTKESKEEDSEDEDSRKAARLRLPKKSGRKSKSKKANVIAPRKRSAKRPARKGKSTQAAPASAKPKSAKLKKDKVIKPKGKKSKSKAKPKSSSIKAAPQSARPKKEKSAKVRARIIRAPSSIPAAFSRQLREMNMAFDDMYQRQGRHIRSRRSVTVLSENATFPAMMHSISIISPIEDLDEKELNAWEKMIDLEGKAEEVSLFEAITKLPTISSEGGYCFTMASLVSASALLAAIVMVLSMSVAMVCMHLHARSGTSNKVADLY